jgi:uncharacterized protein (TIGR02996 family)
MDDKALLAAVLDDPDDDLPRLAYADWLDEHGDDARAEFIRAQVELARTPPAEDRHAQLLARCRELEERHRAEWVAAAPGVVVGDFHRGFPRRVGLPRHLAPRGVLSPQSLDVMSRALGLFPLREFSGRLLGAASPTLQRFPQQSFYPPRGQSPLERLAAWPTLARFAALDLGGASGQGDFQPGVEALAASPFAANLDTLRLAGLLLGEEAVTSLAESPHLTRLRSLDVRLNVPLADRPAVFLETPLADRLEEIDGIDLDTAAGWLRRPGCRLRTLGVTLDPHNDHPSAIDVGPLLGAAGLAGLRRLALHFDGPAVWQDRAPRRGEGIVAHRLIDLLASPLLAGLSELELTGVVVSGAELAGLAGSPLAAGLLALRLRRGRLAGDAVAALRPMLAAGGLRRLDLSSNYLSNATAEALAGWPELSRLHELRLDHNEIDAAAVSALAGSPHRRPWLLLSG